jgi:hypothetical protein
MLLAVSIAGTIVIAIYGQDFGTPRRMPVLVEAPQRPDDDIKPRFVLGDKIRVAVNCISQIGCFMEDVEYRSTDAQGWYVVISQGLTLNTEGQLVSTPEVWTINPQSLYGYKRLADNTLAARH